MAKTGRQPVNPPATRRISGSIESPAQDSEKTLRVASDPTRLQVLRLLSDGEWVVGGLADSLGMSLPQISHHLAILRHAGLIVPRREGRQNYYRLTEMGEALWSLLAAWVVPSPAEPVSPPPDLVFESTEEFVADMTGLSDRLRAQVVAEINDRCGKILTDRAGFEAGLTRPFTPELPGGLDSTLFVMAQGQGLRVILAIDDDPIFGRVLVTLLRVVEPQDEAAAYQAVASTLYRGL